MNVSNILKVHEQKSPNDFMYPKIEISSHKDSAFVELTIGSIVITVLASDVIKAVNNSTNK